MHAGPGAKCAGTNDGRAVRRINGKSRVSRLGQAGEPSERVGRNKFCFAPELHAADDGGQVHIAAALACAQKSALNLRRSGKNGGPGIGDSKTAIRVAMKSELGAGVGAHQAGHHLGNLFRAGAAGSVANHQAAYFLADGLLHDLVEVVQAAAAEFGVALLAVFAAAAGGIHGVLKIHNDLKAMVMEAGNGFPGHEQILFWRGFQRLHHIEEPGFDHHHSHGNVLLVGGHELHIGPIADLGAASARSAEEGQLHGSRIGRLKSAGQISSKLIGPGKTDLSVLNAEGGHALQQADGIGHGNIDIRLLHPVAKTGIEQLDLSTCDLLHLYLFPMVKVPWRGCSTRWFAAFHHACNEVARIFKEYYDLRKCSPFGQAPPPTPAAAWQVNLRFPELASPGSRLRFARPAGARKC